MRFFHFFCGIPALLLPASLLAEEHTQQPLQLLTPNQSGSSATQAAPQITLNDIHGPVNIPDPAPYLQYGLIILALVLLLGGLYWWFFKRKKPGPPPIPPAISARNELMQAREMMTGEQAIAYMENVSGILRRYLEARFNLRTTRQTTRELFKSLTRSQQPEHMALANLGTELHSCLELCDLAKFAHKSGSVSFLQEMEDTVLHIINTTDTDQPNNTMKEAE